MHTDVEAFSNFFPGLGAIVLLERHLKMIDNFVSKSVSQTFAVNHRPGQRPPGDLLRCLILYAAQFTFYSYDD